MNTFGELNSNTKITKDSVRPLANFPPSVWDDYVLESCLDYSEFEGYAKSMEEVKEELRRLIVDPSTDSNKKLGLIYSTHRIGLAYMFLQEIKGQLNSLFKEFKLQDYAEFDLYTISTNFQIFRHLGFKLPCDVFNKFKDAGSGTFKSYITTDVKGMLSLYEAAQMRLRGESILDEAVTFVENQLKNVVGTLEGDIARQVKQSLIRPCHKGMPMLEARLYLRNSEKECSTYGSLLKLAKLHFNYLQLQQKEELRVVTKWWTDMKVQETNPYVRNRVPEIYLWMSGLYFEPHYSSARIIATKITLFSLILDDTVDSYATIEENRLLTDAINGWDISAMEQIPEYIRPFYESLIDEYAELEEQLAKEGRANTVIASKEAFQNSARGYLQEAEWVNRKYVPSFTEYMKNGLITSGYDLILKTALMGMGEIVSEDVLSWYKSHPKSLQASEVISRLQDDVMSYKFERDRGFCITGVESYMKTYGVSEKDAINELNKIIEDSWKDVNEGCLVTKEVSIDMIGLILNLTRMIDVIYRYDDGFTFPEKTIKEYITMLFVESVPV
ncbi:germacrene A synthase short form-like isoform X1 [Rutidosis leptorrhynchoides]|uniref:germacrene A synthase short form-like isoform X1 n=1 Tax=Rutidosis leptorrhynchoides TaxID=125765 RepID=UPI003A9927D7